ncbi:MAG: peptidase M22 [Opitutaceae bacterium]
MRPAPVNAGFGRAATSQVARLHHAPTMRLLARMLSLSELIRDQAPVLILDAASLRSQVGIITADGTARWETQTGEAGVAIFRCVERLGVELDTVRAFVFCEGPGSTLGIRTVAMALRAWQTLSPCPAFAYGSLDLVAHALNKPETAIIADARRDTWHYQRLGEPLRRVPTLELTAPLLTPADFRNWTALPVDVASTPYEVSTLLARAHDARILRAVESPEAFLHEEPSYATWSPHIHRAPNPAA